MSRENLSVITIVSKYTQVKFKNFEKLITSVGCH